MNRLVRPVSFAFEPDVVSVFPRASFGAAGAPTLNTVSSKGVCNWAASTQVWKGTTATSTSVTSMQSLFGVYNGMSVTGSGIPASTVVSSVNPTAGTLTLSNAATSSLTATPLTFSGGQYVITFGSQYTPFKRLDSYVKLLDLDYSWDESVNAYTSTGTSPAAPAAPDLFLLSNQVILGNQTLTGSTHTSTAVDALTSNGSSGAPIGAIVPGMLISGADIPAGAFVTAVSGTGLTLSAAASATTANEILTLTPINPSSIIIQCGYYTAGAFTAANPASGEILRLGLRLSRSNAI